MFQWVYLHLEQLRNCKTDEAVSGRLDHVQKVPKGLRSPYDDIFREFEDLEESDYHLVRRAMMWVTCACAPLSSRELLCAVRIIPQQNGFLLSSCISEDSLLSLCRNLLVVDTQTGKWRPSHASVVDYLESFHWKITEAHIYAATSSLAFLLGPLDQQKEIEATDKISTQPISSSNMNTLQGSWVIGTAVHPFVEYVNMFWPDHARASEQGDRSSLMRLEDLVGRFVGAPFASSMEYQEWCPQYSMSRRKSNYYHLNYFKASTEMSIFGVCALGLFLCLDHWWQELQIDPSLKTKNGHHLLGIASRIGCYPICETLVKKWESFPMHDKTSVYKAALEDATRGGHIEIVRLLLQEIPTAVNMSPTDARDARDGNLLGIALLNSYVEIAIFLIDRGADLNCLFKICYEEDVSLFSRVLRSGSDQAIQVIFHHGVNVNLQIETGMFGSPLAATASVCSDSILEYLVNHGADINLHVQHGLFGSALAAAAASGKFHHVKFLIDHGAEIHMPLQYGYFGNALAAVAVFTGFRAFEEQGERIKSIKNMDDDFQNLRLEIMEYLARRSAASFSMNLKSGGYGSVLAAAAASGNIRSVRYLVTEAEAEVNMPLIYGGHGSALATAAYFGRKDIVAFLISEGAIVNLPLQDGSFANALKAAEKVYDTSNWWEMSLDIERHKAEVAQFLRSLGSSQDDS
ncbi:NACHT nucleoside triphosphatase [Penicillium herquei]|nr:NACHT nucleoside triphosphatase [Penicillium herquei]